MAGNISFSDDDGMSFLLCSSFDCSSFDIQDFGVQSSIDQRKTRQSYFDIVLLGVLSLLGIIGNTGLLLSVCRSPRLRTSANILLTNLVTGDLLYILISAPFFVEHELHPSWQFSSTICKLVNAGEITAQGVCVFSITSLSIERYTVLVRGSTTRQFIRRYRRCLAVAVIWVASILLALPVAVLADTRDSRCDYLPISGSITNIYEVGRVLVLYLFPIVTIAYFYICIAKTLFGSAGEFAQELQPGVRHFNARKRLAFTILVIAIFFGLFWMPYYLFVVLFRFNPHFISHDSAETFRRVYYFAAMSNSCLNPWIVYSMSSTYRSILADFLSCRKKLSSNTAMSLTRYPPEKPDQCKVISESGLRRCTPPKLTGVTEI